MLKRCYEVVFEAELEAWHNDPAVWPQNRDLKTSLEWFDVEFHSPVYDLSDGPIQVIEHESEQPLDGKLSEDTEPAA